MSPAITQSCRSQVLNRGHSKVYMIDGMIMNKLIAFSAACLLPAVNQIHLMRSKVGKID